MSYDIELMDPITERVIEFDEPHQMRGGTYVLGGTRVAELNITYNYGSHYRRVIGEKGIRTIYGMTGADSISVLQEAVAKLGDDVSDDYWQGTEGNAKRPLLQLIAMAMIRPDGVWAGD